MKSDMIAAATMAQAQASDPQASAFVSANAGTGKTKLLTDRVLRLLLDGAPADAILCVTYTRTAAAEMRNRIFRRLAAWTTISATELATDLAKMGITTPSQDIRQRARRLFAEILDNDDGPRVETVHSFCQTILRRFPIEAGVAPHIALADDDEQNRLKALARINILHDPDPELAAAITLIAEITSDDQAGEITDLFVNTVTELDAPDCMARIEAHFRDHLQLIDADAYQQVLAAALASIDCERLRAVAAALTKCGVESQAKRGAKLDIWLAQPPDRQVEKWTYLSDALFSGGKPRKLLSNKDLRAQFPDIDLIQRQIIDLLLPLMMQDTAQKCRERTLALYRYGTAFHAEYSRLKARRGMLDYNDLIICANRLLMASDAAQWVAWKLDNGIEHLLVDEAQDTSPAQWQLLRQLVDAFFDNRDEARQDALAKTVFAVGDFKQSIYSFQGADPLVMTQNRNQLESNAVQAGAAFRNVSLSVSFRSASPILDLVNSAIPDLDGIEDFSTHELARQGNGGFVELMPVVTADAGHDLAPEVVASRKLAADIKSWIGKRKLPSGAFVSAGDILILMRKRRRFFELLLAALQAEGIRVAGADRMKLVAQIEIQDLLALGDVMHLNDDDLQLASVLKSPLFGMTETELFDLAHDRDKASLFARLMAHRGGDTRFGRMADRLARWQNRAEYDSVFGFYSFVLTDGGRHCLCERLGSSVDESLDHFLAVAQKFAVIGGVSLLQFGAAMRNSGGEVKRDMDAVGGDEVRIMTIHGAKGLEAPIVILPDMLRAGRQAETLVKSVETDVLYWLPPSTGAQPDFIIRAKEFATTLRADEDNRLLYVALTRARDGLIIGGWEKGHGVRVLENSDYARLRDALRDMPDAITHEDGRITIEVPQTAPLEAEAPRPERPPRHQASGDAAWLYQDAPFDDPRGRPLRPSQPGSDHVPSPLGDTSAGQRRQVALAYGRLAHRMIEVLPLYSSADRQQAASRLVAAAPDVPAALAAELTMKVLRLIDNEQTAILFSQNALVEVPVNGRVDGLGVAGQIDRLYVDDQRLILADFKTGTRPAGAPPLPYQQQMALYDALLRQIYPGREIECWLVWVEEGTIQPIDESLRATALSKIVAAQQSTA